MTVTIMELLQDSKRNTSLIFILCTLALQLAVPSENGMASGSGQCDPEDVTLKAGEIYSNSNYGYSVVIPKGTNGCMSHAPLPNHGISLVIPGSNAQIWIDAHFNTQEYKTIDKALAPYIQSIKSSHPNAKILSRNKSILDKSPAKEVAIRYNTALGEETQEMMLLTIRRLKSADPDDFGIVYSMGVVAPKVEYANVMRYVTELSHTFVFLWQ